MGKLIAINISRERGTEKKQIPKVRLIRNYGLDGDAHAGRWHRQVSLLSYEKIEEFRKKGAKVENGAFGENLIISGFDFRSLPLGTRFKIGDAVLEMTQVRSVIRIARYMSVWVNVLCPKRVYLQLS